MAHYIYNITLTCEEELLEEVLYYLHQRLIPIWRTYDGLSAVHLLRLPDRGGYALQLEGEDEQQLEELNIWEDSELRRLVQTYPAKVLPFMTKLEVLE